MRTYSRAPHRPALRAGAPSMPNLVVAVVLTRGDNIGLLRRSSSVGSDQGLWHCVTGFVDAGNDVFAQARQELREETGLGLADIEALTAGDRLHLRGGDGIDWVVHTYSAAVRNDPIRLNWENDAFKWVGRDEVPGRGQVNWLPQVVHSAAPARLTSCAGGVLPMRDVR
jgi:ADP-ribose pyrophosphatase YjhB (NUDIX family)